MLRHILPTSVLIIGLFSIIIKCEEFLECFNEEIGAFIPVADSCSKAIYCNGIQSAIVDCGAQNPYFSAKDKMCSDDITVCNERFSTVLPTTTVPTPTTTTSRPPQTTTTSRPTPPRISTTAVVTSTVTSTPKVESITGLITTTLAYSSSPRPTPAVLPTIAVANTTTTRNPSTTAQVIATAASSTDGVSCPLQDDPLRPLYLPHPQSCSQYYLCYHGTPMVMQCPNMLLFDVIQQNCNAAELVNCQLSSISTPPRQCLPYMVTVYPHPKNCNYYYRCEYGYLKVMQCPFGMGWDYEMAICTQLSRTKCYNPSQRYFM